MALLSFLMAKKALVTGVAPMQFFNRLFGRPLITREENKFGFWWVTAPTILLFVWAALGSIFFALSLVGVFV